MPFNPVRADILCVVCVGRVWACVCVVYDKDSFPQLAAGAMGMPGIRAFYSLIVILKYFHSRSKRVQLHNIGFTSYARKIWICCCLPSIVQTANGKHVITFQGRTWDYIFLLYSVKIAQFAPYFLKHRYFLQSSNVFWTNIDKNMNRVFGSMPFPQLYTCNVPNVYFKLTDETRLGIIL